MSKPNTLFVTAKVFYEEAWHLRCISCDEIPVSHWKADELWSFYKNSSEKIITFVRPGNCDTSHIPLGPLNVYGDDPVIKSLPPAASIGALIAQNREAILSNDDLSGLTLPRFLTTCPSTTMRLTIVVKFVSPWIEDLPDAVAFARRMETDDPFLKMLLPPKSIHKTRIPPGLKLPATLQHQGNELPIIYSVLEWQSNLEALVECFVFEPVVVNETTKLVRRLPSSPNVFLLGRVTDEKTESVSVHV